MSQELKHPLEGWTGKTGRQRNRRVVTVEHLRALKRWTSWLVTEWTVGSEVYVPFDEREKYALKPAEWNRPRQMHEYPENDPAKWAQLALYMLAVRSRSEEIYRWAKEQEHLAQERLDDYKATQEGLF